MTGNIFGDDAAAKAESLRQFTRLIRAVHGDTPATTPAVVEIRCLYRGTDKRKKKVVHRWATAHMISGLHDELCDLNDAGYCIYYGANPRKNPKGTTAEDVEIATAQFIDIDGGCTPEQLLGAVAAAGLPQPSFVLESGGGCQAVWPLTTPTPVAEWCARQVGINTVVEGADSTIKDAPRIMRAPGFRNRKPERGPDFPMARLVVESDTRHDPAAFPEGNVYTPPVSANGEPVPGNIVMPKGELPKFATAFLERGELLPPKGKEQPSRRETAFRVAIEMKAAGIDADVASVRISARLYALGLDETAVEDFRHRQLANAYGQERTPTIDPERLPKAIAKPLPAEPEISITAQGGGVVRVWVKRGVSTHVDVLDPAKAAARKKFCAAAAEALGEGTDTKTIDDALKAVAVGDVEPEPSPDAEPSGGVVRESFIEVANIIRPEAFIVADGEAWSAGVTVPKFRDGAEGVEGVWLTFINRHDGTREAIELPTRVTVGDSTFFVHPCIGPPIVQGDLLGWSEASQWQWLEDGQATTPPGELVRELAEAYGKFLHLPDDMREGTVQTLAVWTVMTYLSHLFEVVPYLAVTGVKGTGKSRVMYVLQQTAFRAHVCANPTAAVLFRHLHTQGGTVLVDEAEHLEQMDAGSGLSQTLLTSNTRGAAVPRCDGDENKPVGFTVFGPKGFFSINTPGDTLADRAIHFKMFRAPPGWQSRHPKNARFRRMWQQLRDGLHTMVLAHAGAFIDLPDADEVTPRDMFPRTRETWGPILQLAAVLERLGATGLLANLQAFAMEKAQVSEVATVPEEHEYILRALVTLQTAGKPTTSGDILSRAYVEGLDTKSDLSAVKVGLILANYNLKHGAGRKRRQWSITAKEVAAIETNYGLVLRDGDTTEKSCGGGTPFYPSHPSHPLRKDENTEKNSGFERDGLGAGSGAVTGYCQAEGITASTRASAPDLAVTRHQTEPGTPPVTQKPPENTAETAGVTGVTGGDGSTGVPPTKLFSKPGKVVL